jgi:hypothetical protein
MTAAPRICCSRRQIRNGRRITSGAGNSLYGSGQPADEAQRAVKASYNRPFDNTSRNGTYGTITCGHAHGELDTLRQHGVLARLQHERPHEHTEQPLLQQQFANHRRVLDQTCCGLPASASSPVLGGWQYSIYVTVH